MRLERELISGLQGLELWQTGLLRDCREAGLGEELCGQVTATAAAAWAAVCLAGGGAPARLSLEGGGEELILRLEFAPGPAGPAAPPPGLSAALFCPPAGRVVYRELEGGRAVWTAIWEASNA